jgi:hypothetical protein
MKEKFKCFIVKFKDLLKSINKGNSGVPTEDEKYLINDKYYIKKNEAELYYDDNHYRILSLNTLEACLFYSKNTKWDIQNVENFKYSSGNLYIIIDKTLLNTNNVNRRLLFHFDSNTFINFNAEKLEVEIKSKFLTIFKDIEDNFKLKYDIVWNLVGKYHLVSLNNKWGFIDKLGDEICPIKYDQCVNFNETGFTKIKLNTKWGFINTTGNEICPIKYDDVESFKNKFAKVKFNDTWLYIDQNGNEYEKL